MQGYDSLLVSIGLAVLVFLAIRDFITWYFRLSAMERHQREAVARLRSIEALLAAQAGRTIQPEPDGPADSLSREPMASGPIARAWAWLREHY